MWIVDAAWTANDDQMTDEIDSSESRARQFWIVGFSLNNLCED